MKIQRGKIDARWSRWKKNWHLIMHIIARWFALLSCQGFANKRAKQIVVYASTWNIFGSTFWTMSQSMVSFSSWQMRTRNYFFIFVSPIIRSLTLKFQKSSYFSDYLKIIFNLDLHFYSFYRLFALLSLKIGSNNQYTFFFGMNKWFLLFVLTISGHADS